MSGFLLAIGGVAVFRELRCFSIVKTVRFERKSDALKSMISQS
jgi:hypothetical protein